jgi:hypothetical protein
MYANVREREHAVRRLDERRDVGMLALDLLDDAADRLVDERDPQLLGLAHGRKNGLTRTRPPGDLHRADDQEDREESSEDVLGERERDERAEPDRHDGDDPERQRRPPADVPYDA